MPDWVGEYRIYDTNAPALTIELPSNAPGGDLSASASYTLSPSFGNLDDVTPENPYGDVDRVEYTFASSADPSQPAASPGAVMTASPFTLGFVAAYSGDGVTARPFPVWVKAFDTSGNPSGQVRLDMRVLPNTPPVVGGVAVVATSPVPGILYAGSSLSATATGIADADDARLTLSAELRRTVASGSEQIASAPARTLDRPAEGWPALPQQGFSFAVPISEAEGSALFVRVRATDAKGAQAFADAPFVVADDATAPVVTELVARRPNGDAATSFVIGDTFVLEVRARDLETAVRAVSFATTGGVLPETLVATRVGTSDIFRSPSVTVPSSLTAKVSVEVTARCEDYGGNPRPATVTLELAPSSDPTKPVAEWLSPFEGALWPAAYASVDGAKSGVDLLLRIRVTDRDLDGTGQEIPGAFVNVMVRGPIDASATLATDWTPAALLSGAAGEWIYEAVWRVPNGVAAGVSLPFEVEVIDAGANRVVRPVSLHVLAARYVYEAATTSVVSASDVPTPAGTEILPVFLLDGTTLSLYPKAVGGARSFGSLHLYSGGAWSAGAGSAVTVRRTILTSPEVTSYSSTVPYYPLELSIGEALAVGHGAAIDVTGRGLLGGDGSHDPVTLAGERASAPGAAGSHGGSGHPADGEWTARLQDPGSVYGNIRDPRLPGSGGGRYGGTGGGVVRIDAPSATLRLFGDVSADGQIPADRAGTAGGSVRVRAGRIEGRGGLRANGSASAIGIYRPGGSGGRVSVSWGEPSALTVQVDAVGARSLFGIQDPFSPPAGAGTVFLERLDASGQALDRGTLRISNGPSTYPPALTPLPGLGTGTVTAVDPATRVLTILAPSATASIAGEQLVATIAPAGGGAPATLVLPVTAQTRTAGAVGSADQTVALTVTATEGELTALSSALAASAMVTVKSRLSYAAFEGRGPVRVVSGGELEAGGAVDQRSAFALDPSARVLLGNEGPAIAFDGTTPAPGSSVQQGSTISLRYRAVDSIGLSKVEGTWSPTGTTSTQTLVEPLELIAGPSNLSIPVGQPAGPVTYKVRATDRAGRVTESTATWNVTGDVTNPVVTGVDLSPQRTGDTYVSGETITVTARATDDVKLAKVRIELDGSVAESVTSPATLSWLTPPVASSTTYTVTVTATDVAGNSTPASRTITVTPRSDAVPPTVSIDCPTAGALLPSGLSAFTLQATAGDDQGVHHVEVFRDAEATPLATFFAANGTARSFPVSATGITLPAVTEPTVVRFRVRAFDFGGNASGEVQTEVTVVPAVEISATGPNDWEALSGQTAYVASGTTLVLDQPRTFRDLLVLRGASITHSAGGTRRLDLTVTGSLFIECGGSIDVTGRGYPEESTYPGATGAVSPTDSAGSHVGTGGLAGGSAAMPTYGSVERPREAGSGGWNGAARPGGGVIRIEAGTLALGGATAKIVANGDGGSWRWSRRLDLDHGGVDDGDGLIEAAGGVSYRQGGGAVAIEYGTSAGKALTRVNAKVVRAAAQR
ncbi:MAG: hypothetical protein IPN83_05940 [Holophagales bacterium]|nr:hypothetical protein [Holophagales bacterium]